MSEVAVVHVHHEVTQVSRKRKPDTMFPFKLYDVVSSDEEDLMLITWLPCGTMFEIKNVQLFKEQIIQKHFKCKSFRNFYYQLLSSTVAVMSVLLLSLL